MTLLQLTLRTVVLSCLMSVQTSTADQNNMVELNPDLCGDGYCYGHCCYDNSDYVPTCGWEILLMSVQPLHNVVSYTAIITKEDEHTFRLTNTGTNSDLTVHQSSCPQVNLFGGFGNSLPDVVMSYDLVCNESTRPDLVAVPHLTVVPQTSITTTPQDSVDMDTATAMGGSDPVTSPSTTGPVTTQTTTSESLFSTISNATSIRLSKVKDKCYTGSKKMVSIIVKDIDACGAICLDNTRCQGVNLEAGAGGSACTIVLEKVETESPNLKTAAGCDYWEVVWKL